MHDYATKLHEKYETSHKCHRTNTKITIKQGGTSKQSEKLQTQPLKSLNRRQKYLQQASVLFEAIKDLEAFQNEKDIFDYDV